jgi:hypothetical protein
MCANEGILHYSSAKYFPVSRPSLRSAPVAMEVTRVFVAKDGGCSQQESMILCVESEDL